MADEDDDIPPLEDIPIASTGLQTPSKSDIRYVQPEVKVETVEKLPTSFGGMKKGFLTASSASTATSKSKSNEIIEIKRSKPGSTKDFRILDEVQQTIKEEQKSKIVDNWLTDDLLKEIEADESLKKYFSNPYFMEAITLFQQSPQEALAKYGKNAEVMHFFERMTKILGTHFTSMATKNTKLPTNTDPEVNKLLQDESVRQLLMDPEVVQLMKMLREQPEKAQWMMKTANSSMRAKIQRLIELGLLSVA